MVAGFVRAIAEALQQDAAYEAWCIEQEKEDEAQRASGGRRVCPRCGERSVVETVTPTRAYGGGWNTYERCERAECAYEEVYV